MSDVDTSNMSKISPPMYSPNDHMNGHIPQNYYLTGEGNDNSPGASTETGQSELWNMIKSDMMDNHNDNGLSYNSGYPAPHMAIDPNGYLGSYGYYPQEGYQPLSEETLNLNHKNNMRKN